MSGKKDDDGMNDDVNSDDITQSRTHKLLYIFLGIKANKKIYVKKIYSNKRKPNDIATLGIHIDKYDIRKINEDNITYMVKYTLDHMKKLVKKHK